MFRAGRCRGKLALTDDESVIGFIQYGPRLGLKRSGGS